MLGGYIRSSAGTHLPLQVVLGTTRNMEEIRRLVLQNHLILFFLNPVYIELSFVDVMSEKKPSSMSM